MKHLTLEEMSALEFIMNNRDSEQHQGTSNKGITKMLIAA